MRRSDKIFPHRNRPNLLNSFQLRIILTPLPGLRIIESRISQRNMRSIPQQFPSLLDIGPHKTLAGAPQKTVSHMISGAEGGI